MKSGVHPMCIYASSNVSTRSEPTPNFSKTNLLLPATFLRLPEMYMYLHVCTHILSANYAYLSRGSYSAPLYFFENLHVLGGFNNVCVLSKILVTLALYTSEISLLWYNFRRPMLVCLRAVSNTYVHIYIHGDNRTSADEEFRRPGPINLCEGNLQLPWVQDDFNIETAGQFPS